MKHVKKINTCNYISFYTAISYNPKSEMINYLYNELFYLFFFRSFLLIIFFYLLMLLLCYINK